MIYENVEYHFEAKLMGLLNRFDNQTKDTQS